jgi:putative SOS response-associated peptidase YedK
MCGRYTLSKEEHFRQMLEEAGYVFDEFSMTRLVAPFNVAPSQHVPVILDQAPKAITSAKWGSSRHGRRTKRSAGV